MSLYPLKFKPIIVPKVWGSEVWSLSGYGDNESVVGNGFLKGNRLSEIIEVYMDELVGDKVYSRFGCFFPLLFKFIDARDDLSIQVHPSDDTAAAIGEYGKTEMWYVTEAAEDASIILGFDKPVTEADVIRSLNDNTLLDILHYEPVSKGDVAYIPAGTVHALKRGVKVAEIQQTSDITYRLYDYMRPGLDGKLRQLHIEESLACMDYSGRYDLMVDYQRDASDSIPLVMDEHFHTQLLNLSVRTLRDYTLLDSFVVYMCLEGSVEIQIADEQTDPVLLSEGETMLVPAVFNEVVIIPKRKSRLMEVYVP